MPKSASVVSTTDDPAFLKEKRYHFNGYAPAAQGRQNRPFRKSQFSTFNTILALILLATITVLYISNTIIVNRLVVEVDQLRKSHTEIMNMNEILRSEINRKTNMERISKLATLELQMMFPNEPPVWMEIQNKSFERPLDE